MRPAPPPSLMNSGHRYNHINSKLCWPQLFLLQSAELSALISVPTLTVKSVGESLI